MYHDNKSTRAVYLDREFSNCTLVAHANLDEYCGKLKALSDQLAAVESSPTATRLVIQLLTVAGTANQTFHGVELGRKGIHCLIHQDLAFVTELLVIGAGHDHTSIQE